MNQTAILQSLATLADATRVRLLLVLERHELAVSELCAVLQLPQSTVSRHLRVLGDEGWVVSRSEGTSRYYRFGTGLPPAARRLWETVREPLTGEPGSVQDLERARSVVSRRRTRSQEFFSTAAGQWDAVRRELFGPSPELPALLGLLDPAWEVGDLGCGTGRVAETVAPYVRRVVAVDESPDMLAAARTRLGLAAGEPRLATGGATGDAAAGAAVPNVELLEGRLEGLPLGDGSLDVALLALVLHYVPEPAAALTEARRVLRPGGRVLVVDMVSHGRAEYREQMGHLWSGFDRSEMEGWLEEAGFVDVRYGQLPADPAAMGPFLFMAVARAGQGGSARKR